MSRKAPTPPAEPDRNAWMVTFSDLLMLMLTFFVLLLTMSSMDSEQIEAIVHSGIQVQDNNSNGIPETTTRETAVFEHVRITYEPESEYYTEATAKMTEDIELYVETVFITNGLHDFAWLNRTDEGLVINLDGRIAFPFGSSALTSASMDFLSEVAFMAEVLDANLQVESYVAPSPDLRTQEETWDLALNRSSNAAVFLTHQGVKPQRLRVTGYGYTAGRDEHLFTRHNQILRINIVTGPSRALPWD